MMPPDEPAPADGALPPEVRPLPPHRNSPLWIAFRVAVVLLPLAGLTLACLAMVGFALADVARTALRDGAFGLAMTLFWAGLTAGIGRQTRRSYRDIQLMRLGLLPAAATGILVKLSAVGGLIAMMAAITFPHYRELFRRQREGSTRGGLALIRSALSIYYGDMAGAYPADLRSLTAAGKYLKEIPMADLPRYHRKSAGVLDGRTPDDAGGWLYHNDPADASFGAVWVNCTHTDTKGSVWTTY